MIEPVRAAFQPKVKMSAEIIYFSKIGSNDLSKLTVECFANLFLNRKTPTTLVTKNFLVKTLF